jgi:transcriptional regulator with XRE-family HTH domain
MLYSLDAGNRDGQNAAVEDFAATQFADWIRRLRRTTKLRQHELAANAGVSLDQVRRLEQGENVGLWYLEAILSTLAETPGRSGYGPPSDKLNHPALSLLVQDGAAVKNSEVLVKRRREKPEEKVQARASPRAAGRRRPA